MAYERGLGTEAYTTVLNFSSRKVKLSKKARGLISGTPVISNTGRTAIDGMLLPWEGFLIKLEIRS
jgi:hypothetical protein